MSKIKELLTHKHTITIFCAISIIALFFPIAKVSVALEIMGTSSSDVQSVSGFAAMGQSVLGFLLIVGPVVLIAMNYIKQLGKYKGILALAVPVICLIVLIIMIGQAKTVVTESDNGMFDVEIKTSIGIGAILAILSYIGTAVSGAITYHGITLDKAGLEKIKSGGTNLIETAQEKLSATIQNASNHTESSKDIGPDNDGSTKSQAHRKSNLNLEKTEDTLALIEKLSKMKDDGILTEEEFQEKKKQYLEDI